MKDDERHCRSRWKVDEKEASERGGYVIKEGEQGAIEEGGREIAN